MTTASYSGVWRIRGAARIGLSIGLSLALAGCVATPLPQQTIAWVRVDGKKTAGNAELEKQFQAARRKCQMQPLDVAPGVPEGVTVKLSTAITIGEAGSGADQLQRTYRGAAYDQAATERAAASSFENCMNASGYRRTQSAG